MRRRLPKALGAAAVLAIVMVLPRLTTVPVVGQGRSTTEWGHPNLEGIWVDVYATPFERAPELGEREFTTAEERAARDQASGGTWEMPDATYAARLGARKMFLGHTTPSIRR